MTSCLRNADDVFISLIAVLEHELYDVSDDECCGIADFVVSVLEACGYGFLIWFW